MEIPGLRFFVLMVLLNVFVAVQGTLSFPLDSTDDQKEYDNSKLLALITGIDSEDNKLYDAERKNEKRGQGWAIAYGKRGSQKWSMAYGKRKSLFNKGLFSPSPKFPPTRRAFSTDASDDYFSWSSTPMKRQQGWHIAYGKRGLLIPGRGY